MPRCSSCSAPLPADTSRCSYCGTRNDMDVLTIDRFAVSRQASRRQCPDCRIPLQTIRLSTDGAFAIERCPTCFGLFFDPGELQAFLAASVSPAFQISTEEIININRERADRDRQVRYIPCPECGILMNRVNFGYRSGVVMDQCRKHGVWLDNGELTHLMEWKKAGGQLLADQKEQQLEQQKNRPAAVSTPFAGYSTDPEEKPAGDLLTTILSFLSKTIG